MRIFSNQPVSHTDLLTPPSVASSKLYRPQMQFTSYMPTNTAVVGTVSTSAFPSYHDMAGGIPYATCIEYSPSPIDDNDISSDG